MVDEIEEEAAREGTSKRQNSHGRMKYRGSTRGAVISESAVAKIQIRKYDVGTSPSICSFMTVPILASPPTAFLVGLLVLGLVVAGSSGD